MFQLTLTESVSDTYNSHNFSSSFSLTLTFIILNLTVPGSWKSKITISNLRLKRCDTIDYYSDLHVVKE